MTLLLKGAHPEHPCLPQGARIALVFGQRRRYGTWPLQWSRVCCFPSNAIVLLRLERLQEERFVEQATIILPVVLVPLRGSQVDVVITRAAHPRLHPTATSSSQGFSPYCLARTCSLATLFEPANSCGRVTKLVAKLVATAPAQHRVRADATGSQNALACCYALLRTAKNADFFPDTEEVTGSSPVSPTQKAKSEGVLQP